MFSKTSLFSGILIITACYILGYAVHINSAPSGFPSPTTFTVEENESLHHVSVRLEEEYYIHSALWFRAWVSMLGHDRSVRLGGYTFNTPVSLGSVVAKLTSGNPDVPLVSITVPEGSTSSEIAVIIHKALPKIEVASFMQKVTLAHADGKLFPSTYFLFPSDDEDRLISLMTKTFEAKYGSEFSTSGYPLPLTSKEQVLSLAAILEGEAKTKEDMKVVAGILLNRMKIGLALQVDVAPSTYTSRGLPAVPINNPGLIAIDAVFHPATTKYLYYLTGKDGTMHYATTFAEHKSNIKKFLK